MNFREFLKSNIVYLDGAMGTMLQDAGLKAGEYPERWNITHPQIVQNIYQSYFDAGSNVVCTNTFGANCLKFSDEELEDVLRASFALAKQARQDSIGAQEKFIALDIGPTGKLLKPLGDLDFEDAVSVFAKTVRLGAKFGAELIVIETMSDAYETKAAVLAAKENSDLPIIVTNAYGLDGKLLTGATPEAMTALLEGMGVDAIGANCSAGPDQLADVAQKLLACASIPVFLLPNAGLPQNADGKTVYDVTPEVFAEKIAPLVKAGLRGVGGCCGTTPAHIKALVEKTANFPALPIEDKNRTVVSSYTHAVVFDEAPILIGERINPTGKKRFKQALRENDMDYILSEGVSQQECGVHVLDVNVGLPDIDEVQMLQNTVYQLQSIIDLPLQIDTSDPVAMEAALRRVNGKAMINSVNGKQESMDAVFPLVKKYGGVVVALTLDEGGIPSTAQGRVDIAKKILQTAQSYGIDKKDIIFDTLAMTISADNQAANVTLESLRRIRYELGCHTSLGVSNVSFGLPNRDAVNATFFAMALSNGLSAAIMNPYSSEMMKTFYTYCALRGLDENCASYIEKADQFTTAAVAAQAPAKTTEEFKSDLQRAIVKGFKDSAAAITDELLKSTPALEVVNEQIIPALNIVGEGFEKQTMYLPQLLMSAEAAKAAFERIKAHDAKRGENAQDRGIVVLATVHGDIHDIGKNIVKLLLENYGFRVIDLGKDVPPEVIADAVVLHHAPVAGLSALMTTTVPAMEKTILSIREKAPWCKIVVGGAVLTQSYADKIGADKYARDAMDTVRYVQQIIEN